MLLDVKALLLAAIGLLLGLIVFPIGVAVSKSREAKVAFALLSAMCVSAVVLPILNDLRVEMRMKAGVSIDATAFEKYCADDRRLIRAQPPIRATTVRVRYEREAGAPRWIAGAPGLARRIGEDPGFCARSSLVAITNADPAIGEQAAYVVCASNTSPDTSASAPYDLLIRDAYAVADGTGLVPWGVTKMYKSSIRITREQDTQIVAEADFSFVGPEVVSIKMRCPDPAKEIVEFLAATFPRD